MMRFKRNQNEMLGLTGPLAVPPPPPLDIGLLASRLLASPAKQGTLYMCSIEVRIYCLSLTEAKLISAQAKKLTKLEV